MSFDNRYKLRARIFSTATRAGNPDEFHLD